MSHLLQPSPDDPFLRPLPPIWLDNVGSTNDAARALAAEGLFAAERKRPLPRFPRHIGIVTSPTGAAIRDILRVLSRRFANLHLLIAPVLVQGAGAAKQIADAIDFFNSPAAPKVDVIVVTRGGGSLEDLWAFNEEAVVRALARSRIPTLSAVGHDIDTSLCDFAADASAPTPSAGAEILIRAKSEIAESLLAYSPNGVGRSSET